MMLNKTYEQLYKKFCEVIEFINSQSINIIKEIEDINSAQLAEYEKSLTDELNDGLQDCADCFENRLEDRTKERNES